MPITQERFIAVIKSARELLDTRVEAQKIISHALAYPTENDAREALMQLAELLVLSPEIIALHANILIEERHFQKTAKYNLRQRAVSNAQRRERNAPERRQYAPKEEQDAQFTSPSLSAKVSQISRQIAPTTYAPNEVWYRSQGLEPPKATLSEPAGRAELSTAAKETIPSENLAFDRPGQNTVSEPLGASETANKPNTPEELPMREIVVDGHRYLTSAKTQSELNQRPTPIGKNIL